jgi:hypothetical protein
MTDKHEYIKDGIKWQRVWHNPQLNTEGNIKIDPFDKRRFVDKTGRMKGSYGDLMDYSKELSEERKSKLGYDPVQRKHFDDYEKRIGKKHLLDRKTSNKIENDFISIDLDD